MSHVPHSIDAATLALNTVTYAHHEIHRGNHYFLTKVVDLAINNVYDFQITTPDTTKWAHFVFSLSCESETNWFLYEGVTIITPGAVFPAINNNRMSSNTSGLLLAGITNGSIALANADTATAAATLIGEGTVGGGRTAGLLAREQELILRQNTKYAFRVRAIAAGYTGHHLTWYEHTNAS